MHITRYLECRPLNNNYICPLLEYEIISRDNVHMFVIPTKFPPPPLKKNSKKQQKQIVWIILYNGNTFFYDFK